MEVDGSNMVRIFSFISIEEDPIFILIITSKGSLWKVIEDYNEFGILQWLSNTHIACNIPSDTRSLMYTRDRGHVSSEYISNL